MGENDLGINVNDSVKSKDVFGSGGNLDKQLKGIGGTLHVTKKEDVNTMAQMAWQLSEQSQKPVVVVVRAPRKV